MTQETQPPINTTAKTVEDASERARTATMDEHNSKITEQGKKLWDKFTGLGIIQELWQAGTGQVPLPFQESARVHVELPPRRK